LNTHLLSAASASDNKREERTTPSENKFSDEAVTHPRCRYESNLKALRFKVKKQKPKKLYM